MALGKMLNLGGIDNRPPKANQSVGRFRVARNVMPTPENTLIPRYDNAEPFGGFAPDIRCVHLINQYDNDPFFVVSQSSGGGFGTEFLAAYRNFQFIPNSSYLTDSPFSIGGMDYSQSFQSYRVNNTMYFTDSYRGALFKYDGVEISAAGCPQPKLSTSSYVENGTRFLRAVQHVIDFDNNEPVSEYIQFPTSTTLDAGLNKSVIIRTMGNNIDYDSSWNTVTSAANNDWTSVAFGNGTFVAVSNTGTGNRVMTSTDGITWTIRTSAADSNWQSVCFGNGLFVAVANSGTVANRVMTSPNGITWTLRTIPVANNWKSVTYGNGLFVAVSDSGTGNRVMTSPDGITWTIRTSAADSNWQSITYGNGLFVAVASDALNQVMTSSDGITWNLYSVPGTFSETWKSVTYGNGIYVAVADAGTYRTMISYDGINWQLISVTSNNWNSVTYANGTFIAVASSGIGNRVMFSFRGTDWQTQSTPVDNSWQSIAYGNEKWVAVSSTGTGNRAMYSQGGFVSLPAYFPNTVPSTENQDIIQGRNFFIGSATYSSLPANLHFVISSLETNIISSDKIGSYVIVSSTAKEMNSMGFVPNEYFGLALKIKDISPLILDSKDAKLLTSNRVWETRDLSNVECINLAPYITNGTRTFLSFWECTSSNGIYYFRDLIPSFPQSNQNFLDIIQTTGINSASAGHDTCLFTIGPSLNGWYDVTTKKISFNSSFFNNDSSIPAFSMTKFQSMLLMANDQNIWFSDTSLGGWIEQTSGGSSITVGDKEFGRITSICGTADFLFVGRERRNYYVTGNIPTGNYRVQEISEAELGPWCNASSITVKDSVIFINSLGVFQLISGGKTVKLSDKCPKNFDTFNSNSINEDVSFRLTGTVSNVGNPSINNPWSVSGLSVAYDAYRELLVFMKREENNPCFVLHARTGEFYEWDGMFASTPNMYANCIGFIGGSYYLGQVDMDPLQNRAKISIEDKTSIPVYPQTNPIKLYTSWLTANEPSLEKELLQLKMFGRIDTTSTAGIKVRHYKDWNINTLVTDATYFPVNTSLDLNNQVQFSHKKRLNSDKCLSASVGIEVTQADVTFELESFEVEFNPIQSGMKR